MGDLREDFEWCKKHDPYFSFKTVEEWAEFLKEMENEDGKKQK